MYLQYSFFKSRVFFLLSAFSFTFCSLFFILYPLHIALAQSVDQAAQRSQWEAELKQTESDIAKWQAVLDSSKKNTASLQNEANILTAKINQAKAFIKKKNIAIAQLDVNIAEKTRKISNLEGRIVNSQDSLAQLVKKTNELDQYTLAEVMLSRKNLSEFFVDADSYGTINRSLQALLEEIRNTKDLTQKEKELLNQKKDEEADLRAAQEVQKAKVTVDEQQKQYLIKLNKTKEKTYSQVIAEQQAKAAQIRAKLFNLAGGSVAIPFGTALTYAQNASNLTGVSPAFLLAILTQESNLGANVGKCYLTDKDTGAGVNVSGTKTWSNLMKPSRDVQPFFDITSRLGFDPFKTVVSCPIAGVAGYGGAMGPAQFIPSTWKIFEDRLKTNLGHDANPWVAQDAFMASALYLGDLGAGSGTYSGEIRSACKYYGSGGSSCSYGKSVMKLKNSIQADIDYLNQYGISRR